MGLVAGTRLGVYEITDLIGVGGMGEVYRARDTTLGRDVAIKVLPASFSSDAMRVMRFEQEAKTLASLNHSNIAHVYGLERSAGDAAIVMELVDGTTLMERIAQGPLPVEEALRIAGQLTDALEAAHERGVVHRDLKPANIKLKPDGTVKVLDFGIAKALDASATGAPLSTPATQTGVVLGTPAYMSPEQARGKSVDKRADVWAFGCLLHEMLSGRPAFEDDDVTLTPASLRESSATVDGLATVPPAVRRTIELCLEPDVRKRIRDIGDARLALEGVFETSQSSSGADPTRGRWFWLTGFAVAGLALIALAIPALRHLRETPPRETRVDIVTPSTNYPESFALSPDGRQIVFVASGERGSQLWLRSLDDGTARPLSGTEGAWLPFWRPNSRSIGFFADAWLKRLDLDGGVPQALAPASNGGGGTWNADDVIVFAPDITSPLMRVSAYGGPVTPVLALQAGQAGQTSPYFLPDGVRFLFSLRSYLEGTGIYIGALDGSVSQRLTPSGGDARYLSTGWLLWVRDGALVAQRLGLTQSALTGELVTVAPGVPTDAWRHSAVSVSSTGDVAYRAPGGSQRQLMWFDRLGNVQGTLGEADSANLVHPRVTSDGRRAVVSREDQGNYDLWQVDDGGRARRITTDPARDDYPLLSPDGSMIVFRSARTGSGDLYKKLVGREDPEELLLHSDELKSPMSWSADGRFLMYVSTGGTTVADLWVLPMQGGEPYPFLKTEFRETNPAVSPDGQWVAYGSHKSGSSEVYVKRFFVPGETGSEAASAQSPVLVSTSGGTLPTWRKDGQELYYLEPEGAMMAVPITTTGEEFVPGTPQKLFSTRIYRGGTDVQQGRQYEVAADGRFLINTELDSGVGVPITLIQNWNPDAKR